MSKKVVWAIVGVIVVGLLCVAGATYDSCNRHKDTKPCFGSSSQR